MTTSTFFQKQIYEQRTTSRINDVTLGHSSCCSEHQSVIHVHAQLELTQKLCTDFRQKFQDILNGTISDQAS